MDGDELPQAFHLLDLDGSTLDEKFQKAWLQRFREELSKESVALLEL